MTSPTRPRADRRRRGYVFGVLAALTCPCHLLLGAPLLAGTAAGAFLTENFTTALILLSVLFVLSLTAASRMLRSKAPEPPSSASQAPK